MVIFIQDRITRDALGYDRNSQSEGSLIFTNSIDVLEFELPLTIGDAFASKYPTDGTSFVAPNDDQIVLAPYSCVTIEVAEDISVPLNLFGIILPKGSLAHANGVFTPTTKIDPGFSGRLRLLLFNGSGRRFMLRKGQPVASAVFLRTDATVRHPLVDKREKLAPVVQSTGSRVKEFAKRHKSLLSSILIPLISLIIAVGSLWYARESADAARQAVSAEPPETSNTTKGAI